MLEDLKIEASSTAPLVLPCTRADGSTYAPWLSFPLPLGAACLRSSSHLLTALRPRSYRFMFKQEDLRKDWVVVNVIRLMDIILKEAGMPLNILSYRVLPTSKARPPE